MTTGYGTNFGGVSRVSNVSPPHTHPETSKTSDSKGVNSTSSANNQQQQQMMQMLQILLMMLMQLMQLMQQMQQQGQDQAQNDDGKNGTPTGPQHSPQGKSAFDQLGKILENLGRDLQGKESA